MPIKKNQVEQVAQDARDKAQRIANPEDAAKFAKDYEETMITFNTEVEDCLDEFVGVGVKILRDAYPAKPSGILSVLKEQENKMRDLVPLAVSCFGDIIHAPFRDHVVEYAHQLIDICNKSIGEQYKRQHDRAGLKTN